MQISKKGVQRGKQRGVVSSSGPKPKARPNKKQKKQKKVGGARRNGWCPKQHIRIDRNRLMQIRRSWFDQDSGCCEPLDEWSKARGAEGARGYGGMARTGSTGYKSWKRQIQIHFGKNFSPLLSLSDSHSVSLISFSSPENDGTAAPPSSPARPTGKHPKIKTFYSKSQLFYMLVSNPKSKI
jgi:hypothetical protein